MRKSRSTMTMIRAQRMNTPTKINDAGNIDQQMRLNKRIPVVRRLESATQESYVSRNAPIITWMRK